MRLSDSRKGDEKEPRSGEVKLIQANEKSFYASSGRKITGKIFFLRAHVRQDEHYAKIPWLIMGMYIPAAVNEDIQAVRFCCFPQWSSSLLNFFLIFTTKFRSVCAIIQPWRIRKTKRERTSARIIYEKTNSSGVNSITGTFDCSNRCFLAINQARCLFEKCQEN